MRAILPAVVSSNLFKEVMMQDLRLFALSGTEQFGKRVSKTLNHQLTPIDDRTWKDDEPYIKSVVGPEGNVRGCDAYVLCTLFSEVKSNGVKESINDRFIKSLFFAASLRDASADKVTLVFPYLAYQRQDRKTESRAGIHSKYSAMLIEAMGVNRIITMDAHNLSAFQHARIHNDHLEAKNALVDFITGVDSTGDDVPTIDMPLSKVDDVLSGKIELCVLSPDSGGVGRAKRFRNALERRLGLKNKIDVVHIDKGRNNKGKITDEGRGNKIAGDVDGKWVIVVDDMIASGGTIELSLDTVNFFGGKVWAVATTHGQFTGPANEKLKNVERLITTDTLPPNRLNKDEFEGRLYVCRVADIFAEAIRTTHFGGSISELLED